MIKTGALVLWAVFAMILSLTSGITSASTLPGPPAAPENPSLADPSAWAQLQATGPRSAIDAPWKLPGPATDIRLWTASGYAASYLRPGQQSSSDIVPEGPAAAPRISADLSSGLLAHWKLDETTGAIASDASGNGHDGTLINGPLWVPAVEGNGLEYDRSQNQTVRVDHSALLNTGSNSFSIALWVQYTSSDDADLIRKGSTNTASDWYKVEIREGNRISFNLNTSQKSSTSLTTSSSYDDGQWHHVAAVRDVAGDRLSLYIDGVELENDSDPGGSINNSANLAIGSKDTLDDDFYDGVLDDVRLYGRALSAQEVSDLFNGNTGGGDPNDTTPPSAPTNLVATANGEDVDLSWSAADDADSGVTSYNIYRDTTPGTQKNLIDTLADSSPVGTTINYTDNTTNPATTYYYEVAAVDGANLEGDRSNEDFDTTGDDPPTAPTGLIATPGNLQVSLDWANNTEGDLAGYNVYRADLPPNPLNGTPLTSSDYLDPTIPANDVEYTYSVTAVDQGSNESLPAQVSATPVDAPPEPVTVSFRQGVDGYTGTVDTYLVEDAANTNHGSQNRVKWDEGNGDDEIGLLRFDGIFGAGTNQIPPGSVISSATVSYRINNTGNPGNYSEALVDWPESVTFNNFGGDSGVQPEEHGPTLGSASGTPTGFRTIDVTSSLSGWAASPASNHGWVFLPTGTNSVRFDSSEAGNIANRPTLTVEYISNVGLDLAITSVVPNPASALLGDIVDVDITVVNSGQEDVTEDILVTLEDITGAATPIGSHTIAGGLISGASSTFSIPWDTVGAALGVHTIQVSHNYPDDIGTNNASTALVTITDGSAPVTLSFRQGVDGYTGTVDTYLLENSPNTSNGSSTQLNWDAGSGSDEITLIRFDDIFGSGLNQIPEGAAINSATLSYSVFNKGNPADVSAVLVDWSESVTYATFGGEAGVQPDEHGGTFTTAPGSSSGQNTIDVTSSLSAWAADVTSNHGWVFLPTGTNGVGLDSSENSAVSDRPILTVEFNSP
ncbi:MAG: LamG-like jellyroll fold domain-containing protein [Dehalococcoidia bacterium]